MKRWTIALSAGLIAASLQATAGAQDGESIQVLTEDDAQVVKGSRIVVINNDEAKVVEGKPITVEDVEKSTGKKRVEFRIESSSTSNGEDGDPPKVVTKGKVVVVGPDGQKKEYDGLRERLPSSFDPGHCSHRTNPSPPFHASFKIGTPWQVVRVNESTRVRISQNRVERVER